MYFDDRFVCGMTESITACIFINVRSAGPNPTKKINTINLCFLPTLVISVRPIE